MGLSNNELKCTLGELFEKRLWTIKDVAKVLDVTIGHVYNLKSKDEIPFRQMGKRGRLYFIPDEILDWVDSRGV